MSLLTPILFQNGSQTQFGRMRQAKRGRRVLTYHLSKPGLIKPRCSSPASSRPYGDIRRMQQDSLRQESIGRLLRLLHIWAKKIGLYLTLAFS